MSLIRRHVDPTAWRPSGIATLEVNALDVVKSTSNRSVIAGPGSGKTELLAQRASYLLQCAISPPPRRVLAISYKRDAAFNLARRVATRCHAEQAYRLDSLTFDAFAKGLVDRFGQALPQRWRPTPDYEIAQVSRTMVQEFLLSRSPPPNVGSRDDLMQLNFKTFERDWMVAAPLVEAGRTGKMSPGEWAGQQYWESWLRGGERSYLSFAMIGRLAELLVRTNPMVRQALRLTYSHVFMDEFQDTTQVQYDLVKTIFLGSNAVLTAVGDNKQQIMRFAMAMEDPFTPFEVDFKAQRIPLQNNYRSSPDLVRIQEVLARAMDRKSVKPVSQSKGTIVGESCEVWDFRTPKDEARTLAQFVSREMKKYELKPRDFCVLVRLRTADYARELAPAFTAHGLLLRNESDKVGDVVLQELLSEPASEILISLLRLVTARNAGRYWTECFESVCFLKGAMVDDQARRSRISKALDDLSIEFTKTHAAPIATAAEAKRVVKELLTWVGTTTLVSASHAYRQGQWLQKVIDASALHLEASCKGARDWSHALDVYEGVHSVPLMTIHKSKGLEYHTVIFVGLDDGAWFSFRREAEQETCGFFVAFSRAKQRVVFTYCASRGQRNDVAPLYRLLGSAGVRMVEK